MDKFYLFLIGFGVCRYVNRGIDNKDKLKRAAHLIDTINLLKDRRFWSDS